MVTLSHIFRQRNKSAALMPFITAGYPYIDSTVIMLQTLAEAGADIIELGVPFSDPMADGPAIQYASEKALSNGMTFKKLLSQVSDFRQRGFTTPIVLMGYANSFVNYGDERFARDATESGVSGAIIVDLSDIDRERWRHVLARHDIELISLIAPTTSPERIKTITQNASGFLYLISLRGVTGSDHLDIATITQEAKTIRAHTDIPLVIGFGIRTAEQVAAVAQIADGIVIGSCLVDIIKEQPTQAEKQIASFTHEMNSVLQHR